MTKEKAQIIIGNIPVCGDECYSIAEYQEAKTMAVQALSVSDREKGEWIRFQSNEFQPWHIRCSNCGQYWSIDGHAEIFKYCFNCGADMRNNNNDNH